VTIGSLVNPGCWYLDHWVEQRIHDPDDLSDDDFFEHGWNETSVQIPVGAGAGDVRIEVVYGQDPGCSLG
jgi:hypothetical protein